MHIISKLTSKEWWIDQCLNDLYFLCRNVLSTVDDPTPGYKDLYGPTHKWLCNFIKKYAIPGHICLILLPRGWLKSSFTTIGFMIQRLLRNWVEGRREGWIISNATAPNSREFLYKIKYNLEFNELLRGFFSQFIPKNPDADAEGWTKEEIQILGNRIETGSVEGNLVSRHYSGGMINDDLVNKDNSGTAEQIEKTKDWWRLGRSLKMPTSIEIIPGTRWHHDDLYGYLIDTFLKIPKKEMELRIANEPIFEWHRGNYHLLQGSCWEDAVNKTGSTFPILFPEEKLKQIFSEQGIRAGGQYLNDPLAMSESNFQRPWFKEYKEADIPPICSTIMLVDPTDKEKKGSDYSGIGVIDAGVDKKLYVRYARRHLITDLNLAKKIIELAIIYTPGMIGIEDTKFETIREFLEIETSKQILAGDIKEEFIPYVRTLPFILIELKPSGRPKPVRISGLQAWIESGRMRFAMEGMEDAYDEFLRFPLSLRNDIIDALAYILDVLIFPTASDPPKYLTVPAHLKMTQREREEAEWDQYMEEVALMDGSPQDFEDEDY